MMKTPHEEQHDEITIKLDAIMEYVSVIPDMQAQLSRVEDRVDNLDIRLTRVEGKVDRIDVRLRAMEHIGSSS